MPLFIGQSVVDAHLLNEDMFFYGIVLHPNSEDVFKRASQSADESMHMPFIKIKAPLKSGGCIKLQYLNWTNVKLAKNETTFDNLVVHLQDLEGHNQVRPRVYIHNTLSILEEIRANDNLTVHNQPSERASCV